jgi:hypothetical protein
MDTELNNNVMKIKIQNPDRLVEIYKEVAPNWVMKFRGGSGDESDVYKFGLQSDKSKVWDEFQVFMGKQTKIMYNTETFEPYHSVVLAINDTNSQIKQITKHIKLEEFKNANKLIGYIIDGMEELIQS